MKAKKVNIDFNNYNRVIATSDIHGDDDGFAAFLRQIDFNKNDALVIVGDILEKGNQSLKLLQRIMKMENVFLVCGNNDTVFEDWLTDNFMDQSVLNYMNSREESILIEIAKENQISYQSLEDIQLLKTIIKEKYKNEVEYLAQLPDIMDSNLGVFVHAGLQMGDLDNQDRDYCLNAKAFGSEKGSFEKLVIVGHWPTSNYSQTMISINPYFNLQSNVLSLDGGNSMKRWRQINYVIFQNQEMTFGYYDALPKLEALSSQQVSFEGVSVIFPQTKLQILEEINDKVRCFIPYINQEMTLHKDKIYPYKGDYYASDFTTYLLDVKVGDVLSICDKDEKGWLCKKEGIIGYYLGDYRLI